VPAAELPGAALPGEPLRSSFLTGITGLAQPPGEYLRYGAAAGLGASDNVNFSATRPKSQTLAAANLFFDLLRTGSRLTVSALGNFSDINYLEHAYSNEVLGRFDGVATATLWQNHLEWLAREAYGDTQVNALEAMTPANLERTNVFSTGPDLTLTPTLSSYFDLRALYSRSSYQRSPFDAQAETGSAEVGHHFSPVSTISLTALVEQLTFDNTMVNRNYQRREYYGHYSLQGARTAIDLQAGVTQANDVGSWRTSPLARLSLSRDVSAYSTVTLGGGREYADAIGSFTNLTAIGGGSIPIAPVAQTTANALHTYGSLDWSFHRLRTSVGLSGRWERSTYQLQPQYNVTRADIGLTLDRHLTPALSGNIMATVSRGEYFNQGFTDKSGRLGAGLVYRLARWAVIYGRYDHQFRRPSGQVAQGLSFDENRVFIMIGYYPHSPGAESPGRIPGTGFPTPPGF